eukprot:jgi/Ulvmu1/4918/UM202_0003.1
MTSLVFQDILAPFALENVNCTGSEARLVDCPVATGATIFGDGAEDAPGEYTYRYDYDDSPICEFLRGGTFAFVACGMSTGPEWGDLRLSSGFTSDSVNAATGRLEIFSMGGWGSVCRSVFGRFGPRDDVLTNRAPFDDAAVGVACRQLGFEDGVRVQATESSTVTRTMRRIPFILPGAVCTGNEDRLAACGGIGLDSTAEQCGPESIVTLSCFTNLDKALEGQLRLMGGQSGPAYEYGRLEILLRGIWSSICDRPSITPDSAQLACRLLGYDGGAALEFRGAYVFRFDSQVLAAPIPAALVELDCNGNETSLLQCSSSEFIQRCGIPGTDLTDATVLACANSVSDCPPPPPPVEGSVRLRGGFGSPCDPVYTGFVEIFHLDEWGAICGVDPLDYIDSTANTDALQADVVCRQLGFPHGTMVDPTGNPYDEEEGEDLERYWLADVQCQGPELSLLECDIGQGFLAGNFGCDRGLPGVLRLAVACRTFPVVEALEEVVTPGVQDGDVRLVEQTSVANWQIGRLEVFFEGSWSQVCAENFGEADANVACRQLGFGAGTVGPTFSDFSDPVDSVDPDRPLVFPEVVLTSVGCNGSEARLLDCAREANPAPELYDVYDAGCFYGSRPGLRLACVVEAEDGQEGALRLMDAGHGVAATGTGVLEIFHAGAWGTVCDGMPNFEQVSRNDYIAFDGVAPLTQVRDHGSVRALHSQNNYRN